VLLKTRAGFGALTLSGIGLSQFGFFFINMLESKKLSVFSFVIILDIS